MEQHLRGQRIRRLQRALVGFAPRPSMDRGRARGRVATRRRVWGDGADLGQSPRIARVNPVPPIEDAREGDAVDDERTAAVQAARGRSRWHAGECGDCAVEAVLVPSACRSSRAGPRATSIAGLRPGLRCRPHLGLTSRVLLVQARPAPSRHADAHGLRASSRRHPSAAGAGTVPTTWSAPRAGAPRGRRPAPAIMRRRTRRAPAVDGAAAARRRRPEAGQRQHLGVAAPG